MRLPLIVIPASAGMTNKESSRHLDGTGRAKNPASLRKPGLFRSNPEGSAERGEVHRSIFAATINFEFELESVALVEVGHTGAFNRRDVDEGVRLTVIPLDEAEALHRVEELDRAARLLSGELPRRAAARC